MSKHVGPWGVDEALRKRALQFDHHYYTGAAVGALKEAWEVERAVGVREGVNGALSSRVIQFQMCVEALAHAEEQRDALLEACKESLEALDGALEDIPSIRRREHAEVTMELLRTAIARAEGRA